VIAGLAVGEDVHETFRPFFPTAAFTAEGAPGVANVTEDFASGSPPVSTPVMATKVARATKRTSPNLVFRQSLKIAA
jgi:hypothetical protein